MTTILAPLDFSVVSEAVIQEASALAHAHGGRIVLLTVIQPVALNEYAPMMPDIGEIMAAGERNAARRLGELEERIRAAGIPVESLQLLGAAIPLIVEQAHKCEADYIVMGSHGHTALYDLLVGSTTHGVLMRATCPVVIVPAGKTLAAQEAPAALARAS